MAVLSWAADNLGFSGCLGLSHKLLFSLEVDGGHTCKVSSLSTAESSEVDSLSSFDGLNVESWTLP